MRGRGTARGPALDRTEILKLAGHGLEYRPHSVSQMLARERMVAVEANPRAISQMPNVSSNNPPGMAPTSPAPATPNSSSRLPPAKHA